MLPFPSAATIKHCCDSWFKADKDQLDPVSILATVALMKFKEPDSKIRVTADHQVVVQQPSDYKYGLNVRGLIRFIQRASHEDLQILTPSIKKATTWYITLEEENKEIKELFQNAIAGLKALRATYKDKSGNTITAIDQWTHLIEEAYKEPFNKEQPDTLDKTARKVKNLWNNGEIGKVNIYLRQMNDKQGDILLEIEIKCQNEISQLEFLLEQKAKTLRTIHEK